MPDTYSARGRCTVCGDLLFVPRYFMSIDPTPRCLTCEIKKRQEGLARLRQQGRIGLISAERMINSAYEENRDA